MVAVSAPGKLILMGEHAAVYGLPAVTAAIGLRVTARLEAAAGPGLELELPDLGHRQRLGWSELRREAEAARRRWQAFDAGGPFERDPDPASLVRVAVGETLDELAPAEPPPARLRVDSELPVGSGLGSSAAVAVAVIAGVLAWSGAQAGHQRVARLALEVERRQHGRPSGVDHSTVLRGGLQWARRGAAGGLELEPLVASAGLLARFRLYDSGAPAEGTGTVVAAVADRRRRDPAAFDRTLERMEAATLAFREALSAPAEAAAPVTPIAQFERCLEAIGVVPDPVRRAVERLEAAGGAAKVSGAGALTGTAAGCILGFDVGDEAWLSELAGCRALDTTLGGEGLRREAA